MSTTTNKVNITLAYADATTKTITFDNVRAQAIGDIATRVQAINNNMSDAFKQTFLSADGATCSSIGKAQVIQTTEEVIYSVNQN